MITVPEILAGSEQPGFSLEVLPPLKGRGLKKLVEGIDKFVPHGPRFINITTHRSELVYKTTDDGLYRKISERARPGSVAVAVALQHRYNIPAVPHMICSGYSKIETEYALIDLSFLGINNLFVLRGDKAKHESRFIPNPDGHAHAIDLQQQINDFNRGLFIDGTKMDMNPEEPFNYGVAGYPEKHEESPNMEMDLMWLKSKVDNGASYVTTQMFFDNEKFYSYVDRCRAMGIDVPIIPALKPLTTLNQITLLPKVFKVDMPMELAKRLMACRSDAEVKELGVEWCQRQSDDLIAHGFKSIHYYTHNANASVLRVVEAIYPRK